MDSILNYTPPADVSVSYIRSITNETVYAPWKHKWTQSKKIYKIIYVLKGEYSATVDGKSYHIKENDVLQISLILKRLLIRYVGWYNKKYQRSVEVLLILYKLLFY